MPGCATRTHGRRKRSPSSSPPTAEQIRNAILDHAKPDSGMWDPVHGWGRLDVEGSFGVELP